MAIKDLDSGQKQTVGGANNFVTWLLGQCPAAALIAASSSASEQFSALDMIRLRAIPPNCSCFNSKYKPNRYSFRDFFRETLYLKQNGIELAVVTSEGPADAGSAPLELPRYGIGADLSLALFRLMVHHFPTALRGIFKQK